MKTDLLQILTLFMYFGGMMLCFIRWPRGGRLHTALCALAAALWVGCLALEPKTRSWIFVATSAYMLFISLSKSHRRRIGLTQ